MGNKQYGYCKPNRKRCGKKSDIKGLAFIMIVFGTVSICAFFFPVRFWIVLLSCLLVYCGYKMHSS
ncbi:hypothetical protein [Clostridium aminobutyricum]|uniref:Uncharacterized protein n=1 Tax=Clostridium aminobutyricum TaxID=33953 RepID=A0A939III1_CLOAM|nr:hypothetical protein [Clostridium aminobutyricum]MBN7772573.1 hypothetical protein [Clostridium aminobutyricum]